MTPRNMLSGVNRSRDPAGGLVIGTLLISGGSTARPYESMISQTSYQCQYPFHPAVGEKSHYTLALSAP